MSFEIIADLKIETLVSKFAQNVFEVNSPFSRIKVLVQSTGMSRYLQIKCAEENEIVANLDFEFPTVFIRKIALEIFQKKQQVFENLATLLVWQIFGELKELQKKYLVLKNYLADKKEIGRYQLAVKISQIFNNYLSYRLDWLDNWENGNYLGLDQIHEQWQTELWKNLAKNQHTKSEFELLKLTLKPNDLKKILLKNKDRLPEQIVLFGISALPPIQLDFFKIIAEIIPVKFFYLAPSATFWGDSKRKSGDGNLLLKNWGKHGRDFYNILVNQGLLSFEDVEPENPDLTSKNLLQNIQYLIQENESIAQDLHTKSDDQSIIISANYSKIREIQSLYHWLLQIMNENEQIKNKDILVLIPNLQDYVTSIRATFDNPENEKYRLFYSISDTISGEKSIIIKAFSKLLYLAESRHISEEIFDFFEQEAVAKKMQFSTENLLQIREWITKTKIAWGDNAKFREQILGYYTYTNEQNTWDFGFERLLYGYIYGKDKIIKITPKKTVSTSKIEQNEAILLGNFLNICKKLFNFCDDIKIEKTAEDWSKFLIQSCYSFFKFDDEFFEEKIELKRVITDLKLVCEVAENNDLLPFSVIKTDLLNVLNSKQSGRGFLNGKITFCRLLPMRSIASKVIAILGLNNKDFPLQDTKMAFDLTNISPRECDKNKRNEDQFLFLETLLSAREKFYLSYIGKNNITNAEVVPSIVVSEFLNFLEKNNCDLSKILYKMPLQGFSEKLFAEFSTMKSFSQLDFQLAKDLQGKTVTNLSKKSWQIKKNEQENSKIELQDLENFIKNPVKEFLIKNLNVYYNQFDEKEFLENEPIGEISPLEKSNLLKTLLTLESYCTEDDIFKIGNAEGILSNLTEHKECKILGKKTNAFNDFFSIYETLEDIEISNDIFHGILRNLYKKDNKIFMIFYYFSNEFKAINYFRHFIYQKISKLFFPKNNIIVNSIIIDSSSKIIFINDDDFIIDWDFLLKKLKENLKKPIPFFAQNLLKYINIKNEEKEESNKEKRNIREELSQGWTNPYYKNNDKYNAETAHYFGKNPFDSDETWQEFEELAQSLFYLNSEVK